VKTTRGSRVGVMLLGSQHFGGKGPCWSFGMGNRKSDKQINYSHEPSQIKQQVG